MDGIFTAFDFSIEFIHGGSAIWGNVKMLHQDVCGMIFLALVSIKLDVVLNETVIVDI